LYLSPARNTRARPSLSFHKSMRSSASVLQLEVTQRAQTADTKPRAKTSQHAQTAATRSQRERRTHNTRKELFQLPACG
jgi:hypothetical protein